jgi:hypothetical protein
MIISRNRPFCRFTFAFAASCLAATAFADDPPPVDPDLPAPLDPSVADHLLVNPPFTRALNLSESLHLTGVAYVDGRPVATIKDARTNQHHLVSEQPNAMGWRLAGASPSSNLGYAEVKIMVGTEIVSVHYNEAQMMPQRRSSSGGSSSIRNLRPYDRSRPPTPEEFTGRDDKGEYVRATPYLSEGDRDKMRNMSGDARQKFLNVIHDNRDRMFRYSHDERAGFVKRAFDSVTR